VKTKYHAYLCIGIAFGLFAACSSDKGGEAQTGGAAGSAGTSGGEAGVAESAGTAGKPAAGASGSLAGEGGEGNSIEPTPGGGGGALGGDAGTTGEGGAAGEVATCGKLGGSCCAASSCDAALTCLSGASCSCVKDLFDRYLLRTDGTLLFEDDASAQTPVLDANAIPLGSVTAAMEGNQHGCALLADKTVWCWRSETAGNTYGQLGNGTTDTSGIIFRATQVLKAANQPLTGIVTLSTGGSYGYNTCAATADGSLYCWGDLSWLTNFGTALKNPYATQITTDGVTAFKGVTKVALNYAYACAIVAGAASNEVWCWGNNAHGNLGTGDTKNLRYPGKVLGLGNPSQVIAFGSFGYDSAACALDGTNIRCWGGNTEGQLGNGTLTSPILSPTLVTLTGTTALSGVVDLRGAYQDNIRVNACALTASSALLCWGTQFGPNPVPYGVGNVSKIGNLDNGNIKVLTSDGKYHMDTKVRSPNCGPL
jgi:hypothetical protein